MISAYYKDSGNPKHFSTKSTPKQELNPFVIPSHHLNITDAQIDNLHRQCQKFQTQFSFIKDQIERQIRLKKQKSMEYAQFDNASFHKTIISQQKVGLRDERRLQLGVTSRELQKMKESKTKSKQVELTQSQTSSFMNLNSISHLEKFDRAKYCIHAERKKKKIYLNNTMDSYFKMNRTKQLDFSKQFIFPAFRQGTIYIKKKFKGKQSLIKSQSLSRLSQSTH